MFDAPSRSVCGLGIRPSLARGAAAQVAERGSSASNNERDGVNTTGIRAAQALSHADNVGIGLLVPFDLELAALLHVHPLPAAHTCALPTLTRAVTKHSQQPNEQTLTHQIGLWTRLVLSHAKFHRSFRVDFTDSQLEAEPFSNKALSSKPSQIRGCNLL